MKNLFTKSLLMVIIFTNSCKKSEVELDCIVGVVITEGYRNSVDPSIPRTCVPVIQIKNRNIGVDWRMLKSDGSWQVVKNCVFIANLDPNLGKIGQTIYFNKFTTDYYSTWQSDCMYPPNKRLWVESVTTSCTK